MPSFRKSTLEIGGEIRAFGRNVDRRAGGRLFGDPAIQFLRQGIHISSTTMDRHSLLLPSLCCCDRQSQKLGNLLPTLKFVRSTSILFDHPTPRCPIALAGLSRCVPLLWPPISDHDLC